MSFAVDAINNSRLIYVLNENDVLLGRGIGPRHYVGNMKMFELVHERRELYNSLRSYKEKGKIARDIFDIITKRGGRFLKAVSTLNLTEEPYSFQEADKKTSLEKIKQALRENNSSEVAGVKRSLEDGADGGGEPSTLRPLFPVFTKTPKSSRLAPDSAVAALGETLPPAANLVQELLRTSSSGISNTSTHYRMMMSSPSNAAASAVLPTRLLGQGSSSGVDARLALFQAIPFALQQVQVARQTLMNHLVQQDLLQRQLTTESFSQLMQARSMTPVEANVAQACFQNINDSTLESTRTEEENQTNTDSIMATETSASLPSLEQDGSLDAGALDGTILDLLQSTLGYSDEAIFTKQQEEQEYASLTEEERVEALSDMLGQLCLTTRRHEPKKPRQDLDELTVKFLINQMRIEIGRIPIDKKQELLEAQNKARTEEFSNDKLEQFLRFEGMNPTLAAERFVKYWQCRKEVFGDKFALRMSLSEALSDDLVAIQAGVYSLLPHDLSGRRILYIAQWRHTRKGYDTDSLMRVIWYYMEILAQESRETGNGFNCVVFDKYTTIFDIDKKINDRTTYFYHSCWTVKAIATHITFPPRIMMLFLKPVMLALMSKEVRSRLQFHDGSEDEVLESLAGYGILKSSLPTEMGGTFVLDQSEWIANRRAAELEEL